MIRVLAIMVVLAATSVAQSQTVYIPQQRGTLVTPKTYHTPLRDWLFGTTYQTPIYQWTPYQIVRPPAIEYRYRVQPPSYLVPAYR